jgi:hypothetical protein
MKKKFLTLRYFYCNSHSCYTARAAHTAATETTTTAAYFDTNHISKLTKVVDVISTFTAVKYGVI